MTKCFYLFSLWFLIWESCLGRSSPPQDYINVDLYFIGNYTYTYIFIHVYKHIIFNLSGNPCRLYMVKIFSQIVNCLNIIYSVIFLFLSGLKCHFYHVLNSYYTSIQWIFNNWKIIHEKCSQCVTLHRIVLYINIFSQNFLPFLKKEYFDIKKLKY